MVIAVVPDGTDPETFNPYVTAYLDSPIMSDWLQTFLDNAEVILVMAGDMSTLQELSTALWYSTTIRPVPIVVAGQTARLLVTYLRAEDWLPDSDSRPLDFLHEIDTPADLGNVTAVVASDLSAFLMDAVRLGVRLPFDDA
jgi:predicted Rossmann-fold nucleotide-binding protein